jgi:signal transduction histidine kinase
MTKDTSFPNDNTAPTQAKDVGLLFLANFVHQVVNPLNGIIGTLDNITDGTYEGPVVAQKINASRAQLEQCITLIRNLAYLSDFFFESTDADALRKARESATSVLPQVVIEAAQFFQVAGEKKGIRIENVDSRTQYRIAARPELLRQVFLNLFDNWLKYGLSDQTVKVFSTVNKKKELVIEVVGKSVGFDNDEAERLFELGFRAAQAKNRVAQGSGIGLYICRQIVSRALRGHITAEHRVARQESVFRIAIPGDLWHI